MDSDGLGIDDDNQTGLGDADSDGLGSDADSDGLGNDAVRRRLLGRGGGGVTDLGIRLRVHQDGGKSMMSCSCHIVVFESCGNLPGSVIRMASTY